jgi:ABC-type phosphate/phosphonate transport system substrate-binding protein
MRFGVSRAHGGPRLQDGTRLLVAALEGALDEPVALTLCADYESLLKALLDGELELAWLPPLLQEQAVAGGAHLVAVSERRGARVFRSALLVRAESAYQSLADLQGARAAWSDRHSAASHRFPLAHLQSHGITLAREDWMGSPLAAATAVVEGGADVCAGFVSDACGEDRALAQAEVQKTLAPAGELLRVIDVTGPIPPDGMVVGTKIGAKLAGNITRALLTLHLAPAGRAALTVLMGADKLVAAPGLVPAK